MTILSREQIDYYVGMDAGIADLLDTARAYHDLRDVLVRIRQWDCLNPPQADLLADLPWLARTIDDALARVDGSGNGAGVVADGAP